MKGFNTHNQVRLDFARRLLLKNAEHFEKQGLFGAGADTGGCSNCVVRESGETVMCAVGALMTDAQRENIPSGTVGELPPAVVAAIHDAHCDPVSNDEEYAGLHRSSRDAFYRILAELQGLHDGYYSSNRVPNTEKHRVSAFVFTLRWLIYMIDTHEQTAHIVGAIPLYFPEQQRGHIRNLTMAINDYAIRH